MRTEDDAIACFERNQRLEYDRGGRVCGRNDRRDNSNRDAILDNLFLRNFPQQAERSSCRAWRAGGSPRLAGSWPVCLSRCRTRSPRRPFRRAPAHECARRDGCGLHNGVHLLLGEASIFFPGRVSGFNLGTDFLDSDEILVVKHFRDGTSERLEWLERAARFDTATSSRRGVSSPPLRGDWESRERRPVRPRDGQRRRPHRWQP